MLTIPKKYIEKQIALEVDRQNKKIEKINKKDLEDLDRVENKVSKSEYNNLHLLSNSFGENKVVLFNDDSKIYVYKDKELMYIHDMVEDLTFKGNLIFFKNIKLLVNILISFREDKERTMKNISDEDITLLIDHSRICRSMFETYKSDILDETKTEINRLVVQIENNEELSSEEKLKLKEEYLV